MTENKSPGGDMNESQSAPKANPGVGRRSVLRGGAALALGAATGGYLLSRGGSANAGVPALRAPALVPASSTEQQLHLAATDGWVSMPGNAPKVGAAFWPDPMAPDGYNTYAFGFRDVTSLSKVDLTPEVMLQKEKAQISAPLLSFDQYVKTGSTDNAVRITLSNLGLAVRPDLVDGHTVHWHGFTNAIPLFDGVPELSIAVPIGRSFTYYYRPHDPGTYMYHCHFEDVEHVQMGMTGMVFVRPTRNADGFKYAYDHAATKYDREFGLMLTELWAEAHFRDAHIQTTDWTDFKPTFWLMNGRAYPDTLEPTTEPLDPGADPLSPSGMSLRYNPISSLVKCNAGDDVLLRIANLGYEHHAMTLDGIPMTVVAKDASPLVDQYHNLSYETNTVEVGPGESRDVIFKAPAKKAGGADHDVYRLYDRNFAYLSNGGAKGYGGQMTEVHVYSSGHFGPQTKPNE